MGNVTSKFEINNTNLSNKSHPDELIVDVNQCQYPIQMIVMWGYMPSLKYNYLFRANQPNSQKDTHKSLDPPRTSPTVTLSGPIMGYAAYDDVADLFATIGPLMITVGEILK